MLGDDVSKSNCREIDEGEVETFKGIQIIVINVRRCSNAWRAKKLKYGSKCQDDDEGGITENIEESKQDGAGDGESNLSYRTYLRD